MEQNRRQTGPKRIVFHGIFEVIDGDFNAKVDKWDYEGVLFAIIHLHQALVEKTDTKNQSHIISIIDVCGQSLLLDTAKAQKMNDDMANMKIELTESAEPYATNVETIVTELMIENAKLIHILLAIRWLLVELVSHMQRETQEQPRKVLEWIYEDLENKKKALYIQ